MSWGRAGSAPSCSEEQKAGDSAGGPVGPKQAEGEESRAAQVSHLGLLQDEVLQPGLFPVRTPSVSRENTPSVQNGMSFKAPSNQTIPGFWDSVEIHGEVPCSVCLTQTAAGPCVQLPNPCPIHPSSAPHHPQGWDPALPPGLRAAGCSCVGSLEMEGFEPLGC